MTLLAALGRIAVYADADADADADLDLDCGAAAIRRMRKPAGPLAEKNDTIRYDTVRYARMYARYTIQYCTNPTPYSACATTAMTGTPAPVARQTIDSNLLVTVQCLAMTPAPDGSQTSLQAHKLDFTP
ncbi:hypothetical protein CFE70_009230 [Pyrenophora teres f. teres 0-1]